jgi:hypothetical protein
MAPIPQRIILSRKGFDKTSGGFASPIIPLGTHDSLVSIPIPGKSGKANAIYQNIQIAHCVGARFANMGSLLALGNTRITPASLAHLDPDLDAKAINRPGIWRPVFGQASRAASHLRTQGVCRGDLFLFFGWFRRIHWNGATWAFVSTDPGQHVIFGWLQVAYEARDQNIPSLLSQFPGLATHPHFVYGKNFKKNTVYVATNKLSIPGLRKVYPGGGFFDRLDPKLVLTNIHQTKKSIWLLPGWAITSTVPSMTYHRNPKLWSLAGNNLILQTVGRGQEFVVQANPAILNWVANLF